MLCKRAALPNQDPGMFGLCLDKPGSYDLVFQSHASLQKTPPCHPMHLW
jgi:hypothetical protein